MTDRASRLPLETDLPIVAAPMAGGPSTVALARAVTAAGGLPFLAGGYKTPGALGDEIESLAAGGAPFGVNLFVPSGAALDVAAFRAYAAELQPEADAYGLRLDPEPVADDDAWDDKLALLLEHPVPVVSFTFGLPPAGMVARLRRAGTLVLGTVTTPDEAGAARDAGVDGLVVQGASAGGHSGTFDPARAPAALSAAPGTPELVAAVVATAGLPVVAAGGVDGPDAVRDLLAVGAQAVAVGTLLLRSDEAGTSPVHRAALADRRFERTVVTRAFTGRPARALENGFARRHDAAAPVGYPAVHHLTRPLRQAAAAAGDADRVHLWAGTGYRSAVEEPAGDVVRGLAAGL
ncbi:NAD(P)H-dependent flavin oxidoreductase [Luteimicrobium sp. NPDC057192]|uniref:NAD(P)H-dependent flavin oxidoreductase n=1 Tax=Luteimicrobium sp. NPDC057192 TaxID=3346042 RepID=UPI003624EB84